MIFSPRNVSQLKKRRLLLFLLLELSYLGSIVAFEIRAHTHIQSKENKLYSYNGNKFKMTLGPAKKRLILHFDVNETILACDEAGGDTKEDCLNKMIAKNAFVRIPPQILMQQQQTNDNFVIPPNLKQVEPTHWWDGTPISCGDESSSKETKESSPPELHTKWDWIPGCAPYYKTAFKKKSKTFTLQDGAIYRPLYHTMEERLLLQSSHEAPDSRISHDGKSHFLFPAFYHTLAKLDEQKRDFTLVLRTFGSDLSHVADAITAFATGRHPDYPNFNRPDLILMPDKMFRGRWKKNENHQSDNTKAEQRDCTSNFTYHLYEWCNDDNEGSSKKVLASGDDEVHALIESSTICGIQDDYSFWDKNNCQPQSGKPIWICVDHDSNDCHHVMFDDNIHNDPFDSIVGVRYQEKMDDNEYSYRSLTGKETQDLQGKYLVRVPTVEPILNIDWFLQQIERCEENVAGATLKK